jgi:flavin-dependent dehydrogenase
VVNEAYIAVGDAANTFDPLSTMGVLKALQTGRSAAGVITQLFEGSSAALAEFAESRKQELLDHLNLRRRHYKIEQRWGDHPFWARRTALYSPSFEVHEQVKNPLQEAVSVPVATPLFRISLDSEVPIPDRKA